MRAQIKAGMSVKHSEIYITYQFTISTWNFAFGSC